MARTTSIYFLPRKGFDVPEANVVISYDYLKDTVELSQRFGRGRQKDSSLTLMSERKDRPLSALKDVQTRQESIIKQFDPACKKISLARQQSQMDRERAAFSVLKDSARCERSPLEVLNMYAAKTRAVARVESAGLGANRIFESKHVYESISRTVYGTGQGATKKQAQHQSALDTLNKLRELDIAQGRS